MKYLLIILLILVNNLVFSQELPDVEYTNWEKRCYIDQITNDEMCSLYITNQFGEDNMIYTYARNKGMYYIGLCKAPYISIKYATIKVFVKFDEGPIVEMEALVVKGGTVIFIANPSEKFLTCSKCTIKIIGQFETYTYSYKIK